MQLYQKGEILRGLHVTLRHIIKEHQMCTWILDIHFRKTTRFPYFHFDSLICIYTYTHTRVYI